jgi:hypothetical protein
MTAISFPVMLPVLFLLILVGTVIILCCWGYSGE